MKPPWLKKRLALQGVNPMKVRLRGLKLHSVCEEARCPNLSDCFSKGVATVMIMGDVCTRSCKFCAVKSGRPGALDPKEPLHVALWVQRLGLKHVVITSVDRDDLSDLGSQHFARVIREVRQMNPDTVIEVLTPDFQGRAASLRDVCEESPEIVNHNIETVARLTPKVRSASRYERSLGVLSWVKGHYPRLTTKSGLMLGLGEEEGEVIQAMKDLVEHSCDLLTLGQYLRPSGNHLPVVEYIRPEQFNRLKTMGEEIGFKAVFAGPFVRSSYLADQQYEAIK